MLTILELDFVSKAFLYLDFWSKDDVLWLLWHIHISFQEVWFSQVLVQVPSSKVKLVDTNSKIPIIVNFYSLKDLRNSTSLLLGRLLDNYGVKKHTINTINLQEIIFPLKEQRYSKEGVLGLNQFDFSPRRIARWNVENSSANE